MSVFQLQKSSGQMDFILILSKQRIVYPHLYFNVQLYADENGDWLVGTVELDRERDVRGDGIW